MRRLVSRVTKCRWTFLLIQWVGHPPLVARPEDRREHRHGAESEVGEDPGHRVVQECRAHREEELVPVHDVPVQVAGDDVLVEVGAVVGGDQDAPVGTQTDHPVHADEVDAAAGQQGDEVPVDVPVDPVGGGAEARGFVDPARERQGRALYPGEGGQILGGYLHEVTGERR
jgi:hypothetical protein